MEAGEPSGRADQSFTNRDGTARRRGLTRLRRDPSSGANVVLGSAQHRAPRGSVVDWVLVAFLTLLSGWTALVAVAFLPWHIGAVPMPVSAFLGVGTMILAPRACYGLTGSFAAAVLPVASWFIASVWLVLLRNPLMHSQAVTVAQGQWRVMLLLGLGALAAAATLTLLWADRAEARYAAAQTPIDDGVEPVEPDEPPVRSP
jgi:hypothetical protein